jgi:hypothetical protein
MTPAFYIDPGGRFWTTLGAEEHPNHIVRKGVALRPGGPLGLPTLEALTEVFAEFGEPPDIGEPEEDGWRVADHNA